MAKVVIKNVNKEYDGTLVIEDMNIAVKDAEFLVLVGPSGCGKTTTLKMIAGIETITSGEIYIGDRLINKLPPKDRRIAMVFQEYALYPNMTAYGNIAFGLKIRHEPKKEIDKKVRKAAEMMEIAKLLDRAPAKLSGGERQRVALCRAIVRNPDVFLFDEPLSNLDSKLRIQARNNLIRLHNRLGVTSIYVTHDQTEAMTMGDRVVVLHKGAVQQIGAPAELYDHPQNKHVAGFIGTPMMNFISSKLGRENGELLVERQSFRLRLPGIKADSYVNKEVILGVRPEDISLSGNKKDGILMKVEMVEPLGTETIVYLTLPELEEALACLTDNKTGRLLRGEEVRATFDLEKAHLFDKVTEKTIV